MTIKVVVFDIGDVLERVDDSQWPGPWEQRLGLEPGGFAAAMAHHEPNRSVATGELSEAEMRQGWMSVFGLEENTLDELMRDMWDWYCGELDAEMFDYFVGLRDRYRTAILSNSGDGARREEQRRYGFEDITEVIIYSHEVGLAKPDPEIYRLTTEQLRVDPCEIVFLDDKEENVVAARRFGWHAVVHTTAAESIAAIEAILRSQSGPVRTG